ncbi:MAG: hypothetical protein V4667_04285 [Bacteroidota bacterium]
MINHLEIIILCSKKNIFDYVDIFLDPIVAIITFILGIWVSNYFTNKKENKKLSDTIDYFDLYYLDQKKSIDDQIEAFGKLEKDLDNYINTNGLPYQYILQPYSILETINKETLLNAWTKIKNRDPKTLMNILKFIEFIKTLFTFHQDYHKDFLIRQNELRNKWQKEINEFMVLKGKMLELPKEEIIKNMVLSEFNNICNNWLKPENVIAFKDTIKYLVEPVMNLYGPIYQKNPEDKKIYELLLHVQKIDAIYKEWTSDISQYKVGLNGSIQKVTAKLSELNEK